MLKCTGDQMKTLDEIAEDRNYDPREDQEANEYLAKLAESRGQAQDQAAAENRKDKSTESESVFEDGTRWTPDEFLERVNKDVTKENVTKSEGLGVFEDGKAWTPEEFLERVQEPEKVEVAGVDANIAENAKQTPAKRAPVKAPERERQPAQPRQQPRQKDSVTERQEQHDFLVKHGVAKPVRSEQEQNRHKAKDKAEKMVSKIQADKAESKKALSATEKKDQKTAMKV